MKFICDNWMCDEFHNKVELSRATIKVVGEEVQYFLHGERINCEVCGMPLIELKDEEFKGFGCWCGGFDGKSPDEKREILKKREREHTKRDKVFKDYKQFRDNGGED